jgi:hypothetical protein
VSPVVESGDPHRLTRELIDRNGQFLPEAIRADYFREMAHLTVLPEHDEMLRILRALQFLSLIIGDVPSQITKEREKLGELLSATLDTFQAAQTASIACQKQMEQRLAQLPIDLTRDIKPGVIADSINESLRQQFRTSGIPEAAYALGAVSKQISQTTTDFQRTATQLAVSCSNAADEANRSIENVRSALLGTTDAANQASESLKRTILWEYRWTILTIWAVVFAIGFSLGIVSDNWINSLLEKAPQAVAPMARSAPIVHKAPVSKETRTHRKSVSPSAQEAGSPGSKE